MSESGLEKESLEVTILKNEWRIWDDVLSMSGTPYIEAWGENLYYDFLVTRAENPESIVTGDAVGVFQIPTPLEDYMHAPSDFHSLPGEKWIEIKINPRNPYNPMIGLYRKGNSSFYYTDQINIYLSNLGRGYQQVDWAHILKPDVNSIQFPSFSFLKRYPTEEEIQVIFEDLLPGSSIEPFEPIKGGSLERLDFIKHQFQQGNVIVETQKDQTETK